MYNDAIVQSTVSQREMLATFAVRPWNEYGGFRNGNEEEEELELPFARSLRDEVAFGEAVQDGEEEEL